MLPLEFLFAEYGDAHSKAGNRSCDGDDHGSVIGAYFHSSVDQGIAVHQIGGQIFGDFGVNAQKIRTKHHNTDAGQDSGARIG